MTALVLQSTHIHPGNLSRKKVPVFFRQGASITKVRFYNASVYVQQQEVAKDKQKQQNQNYHNEELIFAIAQTNTA